MSDINCYNYVLEEHRLESAERPLKAVVLTSVRDVGKEDRNGQWVNVEGRQVYMEGLLEAVVRAINAEREEVAGQIRVVGVINDDCEKDKRKGRLGEFPASPISGMPWIHPLDLRDHRGELVVKNTANVPSDFRWIPGRRRDEKAEAKQVFEDRAEEVAREMGADILISDHLMMRVENLLAECRGWTGKVLNIHPAMTRKNHEFALRGPTPTQDALNRANGFRIDHTTGEHENVQPYFQTGATFHIVNREIDDGMVLADWEGTQVQPDDEPQALRYRNYTAKIRVFLEGIRHYVRNIYPNLNYPGVDWLNGHEPTDVYAVAPLLYGARGEVIDR